MVDAVDTKFRYFPRNQHKNISKTSFTLKEKKQVYLSNILSAVHLYTQITSKVSSLKNNLVSKNILFDVTNLEIF